VARGVGGSEGISAAAGHHLRGNTVKQKDGSPCRFVAAVFLFSLRWLFDLNIAGAGANAEGGAATVDHCIDVMAVKAALHSHGLGHTDIA
jgi:hypothetical protein